MKTTTLSLGLSLLLAVPLAQAEITTNNSFNANDSAATGVDNSRRHSQQTAVDRAVDNSVETTRNNRLALTRQYLMDQQYRNSQQQLDSERHYASGVGQGAGNSGGANGHQLGQSQGGVSVGSLVSESNSHSEYGQRGGGSNWQFAPQSNSLSIGGDSYAPINLSNINANGGTVHIGDINKGNLYNSQIGSNQYGSQGGDTANSQSNSQQQQASSATASRDSNSNQ